MMCNLSTGILNFKLIWGEICIDNPQLTVYWVGGLSGAPVQRLAEPGREAEM